MPAFSAQTTRKLHKKFQPRSFNLNLILWVSFSVFTIVVIAFFAVVQNVQIKYQYRAQTEQSLRDAGDEIVRYAIDFGALDPGFFDPDTDLSRRLLAIANRYNVSVYLFTADGRFVFPEYPVEEQEEYVAIYEEVRSRLGEEGDLVSPYDTGSGSYAHARRISLAGGEWYLYLSSSTEHITRVMNEMGWLSLITGLFAVALAFVVSGLVSMVITKPISEVAEKAKELARGNYEVNFESETYACLEVKELSESLSRASAEISKADKMQKELIANVSHDFKTPLTMIKAYASMIREISGDDKTKRDKHAQVIIDEADRLAALVGDVLDLSKLQAGIEKEEFSVFNLSEDVYAVTNRFDFYVETEGYTIHTDIDDDLYTFAARGRVEQVLYNLIGNAISYTGADKSILVRLKAGKDCSHFEVIDTGKGIPKEELDTIWDRYYRSNEAHKRLKRGTGLGLSIVKSILVKYGIRFGVKSEVGKGSCFWVDFPLPNGRENKTK